MKLKNIVILPTTTCNIGCRTCGLTTKNETMSDELLEKLLDELHRTTITRITLTGGETLQKTHADRLISHLRDSQIGRGRDINIFTNASWAENPEKAEDTIQNLESAYVSQLHLSTDEPHREFVPLEYIANAIKAAEHSSITVGVEVKSFRSTFKKDVKAIYELADMLGKKVTPTSIVFNPNDQIERMLKRSKKRFKLPYFLIRRKSTLKNRRALMYMIGDSEGIPPPYLGIFDNVVYVTQEKASYSGHAQENLRKRQEIIRFNSVKLTKALPMINHKEKCKLDEITIMPDGSILPCCQWEMMNEHKQTRVGTFPEMSIEDYDKETHPLSCLYFGDYKKIHEFMRSKGKELDIEFHNYKGKGYLHRCKLCTELHK